MMSDLLLLELFASWNYKKVIAPYSRLYVDVEKYWGDEKKKWRSSEWERSTQKMFTGISSQKNQSFYERSQTILRCPS